MVGNNEQLDSREKMKEDAQQVRVLYHHAMNSGEIMREDSLEDSPIKRYLT